MKVFSHRGSESEMENTLSAFTAALKPRVSGIELYVRLCGSGEVVCFHDPAIFTSKRKLDTISATSLQDLKLKSDREIPTLNEALEIVANRAEIVLNLKTNAISNLKLETEVIQAIKNHNLENNITLSSENPWSMVRCFNIDDKISRAFIISKRKIVTRQFCHLLTMQAIHPEMSMITPRNMRIWKRKGWVVRSWANSITSIINLKRLGVDVVITDYSDRALRWLKD